MEGKMLMLPNLRLVEPNNIYRKVPTRKPNAEMRTREYLTPAEVEKRRRRGWNDAIVYLPHDGVATNNITGKRYIDHWTEAGFECGIPIKNTGAGAAMMRIEAARRVFPRC